MTRLTGELGTANGEVTRLTGELGTANGEVTRLMGEVTAALTTIGSPDDAPDPSETASLHAQLNAAKARIAALEGGTATDILGPIKMAASDAATAANDASTAANLAADEAEMADDNRATIQTGEANSVEDAMDARMYATMAMGEAIKAKTASDAAQAAMNTADATPQRMAAEAAQKTAEEAQMKAETARDEAKKDALVELKIDDKTKSVGETSVTIDGETSDVTSNSTRSVTGLLKGFEIETTGPAIPGTGDDLAP